MTETFYNDIRREDIPAEYLDIADSLGLEVFLRMTRLYGGQSLYVPKAESLEREARDRSIRSQFDGRNYRTLGTRFRLSERQIRKIVNGTRT